jgi:CRISPR-associated endonuclease/helicase Cas3
VSQPQFDDFFQAATKTPAPYEYQRRLACGEHDAGRSEAEWLTRGTDCQSQLINIPTGLGKTAAVVLAWLWNRVQRQDPKWPRRLVYCLPMRTLVEQTEKEVKKWLGDSLWDGKPENRKGKVGVHILMGGEDSGEWDIYPEENAILIGTQDMLLSRALNRSYGMSRYRWPMHFGLLNNDCLWVMDETQLMGVGVETSAQFDGFRHDGKMPTFGTCQTWWMSATLEDARLATIDHPRPSDGWNSLELSKDEREKFGSRPKTLFEAPKTIACCEIKLSPTMKDDDFAKKLASLIVEKHKPETLTLVVVNRVERAQRIYSALTKPDKKTKQPLYDATHVALVHSRFRRTDRKKHETLLFGEGDRIVIATQAVEAGVDVSARLLITELAPWSSLVQRIGRCNRRAKIPDATVLWVDIEPDAKGELLLPYTKDELDQARTAIIPLKNASPKTLREIKVASKPLIRPVIRRRDLVDLFDTTPDICGQDLDISRYIRDGDDNDVQFFWRDITGDTPNENEKPPQRNELCRVSIGAATKFLSKKPRAWRWNPLEERWETASHARPGGVYLVDVQAGGYDDDIGWTGNPKNTPTPHPPKDGQQETYAGNRLSFLHTWQTIAEHTALTVKEMDTLAALLAKDLKTPLHAAALWHDIGKALEDFQKMLRNGDATREGTFWAKSANADGKGSRRGFRHELASALAWLLADTPNTPGKPGSRERDLAAYLIAAHHGKVRLSIRSLPDEKGNLETPDALFARGIWQGDKLPSVPLGELVTPEIQIDLSFMQMGEGPHGASWLARTVSLRDQFGPFRLAYLETLLRAADARASRKTTN